MYVIEDRIPGRYIERVLGSNLGYGVPGDISSVFTSLTTAGGNIRFVDVGLKRSVRLVGVPTDVNYSSIREFRYRLKYDELHGYKVVKSYSNMFIIDVPAGGKRLDVAKERYINEADIYGCRELYNNLFNAMINRVSRVTHRLLVLWLITIGASSLGSSDMIRMHIDALLNRAAEHKGSQGTFLVKLLQLSRPEVVESSDVNSELTRRVEKLRQIIFTYHGTTILFKYNLYEGSLDNEDIGHLVNLLEALAYSETTIAAQVIDIFRNTAMYEVVSKPVTIGSHAYEELLDEMGKISNAIVVAVGTEAALRKLTEDLQIRKIKISTQLLGRNPEGPNEVLLLVPRDRSYVEDSLKKTYLNNP